MLFTSKNSLFSDFAKKKIFLIPSPHPSLQCVPSWTVVLQQNILLNNDWKSERTKKG